MDKRYFSRKIVEWYLENKRDLPWRQTSDPYKIWLSEVILQQTRVNQGLPYYNNFVSTYPTVQSLAAADEREVLRMWQGLGYYTRARNLHKCAGTIAGPHGGAFPTSYSDLKKLPGIGDYTAAAIASFAFREPVAVLDGNVFRVLSRLFGLTDPIDSPKGKLNFAKVATSLLSKERPDLHNQAMMEFGATVCLPANPQCQECIFRKNCIAARDGVQAFLPVKSKAPACRRRYFNYFVFKKGRSLLMRQRTEKDIWLGLFDFPLIEKNKPLPLRQLVASVDLHSTTSQKISVTPVYKHILSHQTIFCRFIIVPWSKNIWPRQNGLEFYSFREIDRLPKPALISRFLDDYSFYS